MAPERTALIVAMVVVAGELAAAACPSPPCLAIAPAGQKVEATVPMLDVPETDDAGGPSALGARLWLGHEEPAPADPADLEVPAIWIALAQLRDCFPRIEGQRDEQPFTAIFTPVIVTGPHDTVPGVGVGGDF